MPHAVFDLGPQTVGSDIVGSIRQLIPGIEPGMGLRNIFAQDSLKPALLIQDAWVEPIDFSLSGSNDFNGMSYYLKLSQEPDLTPGLRIPIGMVGSYQLGASTNEASKDALNAVVKDLFRAQGTIWVPRFVGILCVLAGNVTVDVDVHLDYEVVEIPWVDWFVRWDFLDNVVNNAREF